MIGKTISHYRILGQVGEGGMGVVYVAEDLHLGRRVAIKIPHAGRDESHYRARFLREARSVSKLRHPNIAAVHDYGETDAGQPFIVMELVSGQTLGDVLAGPGLSIARAVEVARETAEALSEAHRRGVVHRDIKPSNVVIDEGGEVKVLDFGLAKQLHEDPAGAGGPESPTLLSARTRSDVVIGTPLYLSPEQARGSKVDGRSDLFALGALLYECLTGRPAFSGSNVIEIGAQVLHFDPPPPSRFNPRVPAELDRLTLKALAKRPEDRFQTAAEFADALARVGSRLPASDTTTTRRLTGAEGGQHRSSALITMAEALRRPKFSPLTLVASLAALGLVVAAVAYVRRPSAHRPGPEVAALYEQGADAMRQGSYHRARVLLSDAVGRDGEYALARARLAEALWEMDFHDSARDEMFAVVTLVPDFSVYPRAEALRLAAIRATVSRNYATAVESHEQIVKLAPESPQAHLDLGRAYERADRAEKAAQSYTAASTHDPSYAAAHLRLGTVHIRQGNQAGASAAFDRAQKLYAASANKEGEAAVRYQRGRLLFNLQQKAAEAQAEFRQSLALAEETKNTYQQVQALLQLAQTLPDGEEGLRTALKAVDIAHDSDMNDQVANGYLTLGNILFTKLSRYEDAEARYNQAFQYAHDNKLRRYEALSHTNLASLYEKQSRLDEAVQFAQKAREFYLPGGYRNDADRAAMIIARAKKRKGDYGGALSIFEEMLGTAAQAGDNAQAGSLRRECGNVLNAQGQYAQALKHFPESLAIARAINNTTLLNYTLLNQGHAFWSLGRYEEAAENFRQLTDPRAAGVTKDLLVTVLLDEAAMELSRERYAEAAAKARQALALIREAKTPSNDSVSVAEAELGLAETLGGSVARGRALCEGAARLAGLSSDPLVVGQAQLTLALALLKAGDAAGARAAALSAREVYARLGRADSEWRALAVAGKASRRAGDEVAAREYLARAEAALTRFEQSQGAEAAGYLSRPDVQWLRSESGVSTASAGR